MSNDSSPSLDLSAEVLIANPSRAEKIGALRESPRGQITQTASAPILQFARYDGTFRLSVSTSRGQTYVLEYKNSMDERAWQPLSTVSGDGAAEVLSDPSATASQRFYRVRVE